jgi:hypothetical protein
MLTSDIIDRYCCGEQLPLGMTKEKLVERIRHMELKIEIYQEAIVKSKTNNEPVDIPTDWFVNK